MRTLDELRQGWPDWSVWVTGSTWVATRRVPRPEAPPDFYCPHGEPSATLIEDGPDELRAALEGQAAVEEAIANARTVDHDQRHPLGPGCPLGCLGLKVQTERALLAHWVFGGRYVPTVADLVALRESGDLDHVPGIGRGRLVEITARLKELAPDRP
ncbi:hypothetical protein [Actinocorallia populi]|uniref:hypothetical protein n=1 Tax=Actinocorallia populi TaxID=2079200 RepID=UPI000D08A4CD|nr:hypothetical protein [Actinocorallia populi]